MLVLPAPRARFRDGLEDEMLGTSPDEELLNVPEEELEDAIDLFQCSLGPLDGYVVMVLPAPEAAAAASREVVDDFAMAVFGRETEGDLPVWSD